MIKNKILAVIKISRPINFFITALSIYVACIICSSDKLVIISALFASISGGLIASAGNIINDIFDIKIDEINRPGRVLPKKELTVNQAWLMYFIFNVVGIWLVINLNITVISIAALSIVIVYLYSWKIKKISLAGNFVVSIMTALAFFYGGVVVNNVKDALIPAGFAFLINLIREIVKDMEDIEGDRANGIETFPIKNGSAAAAKLAIVIAVLLILFTFVPFIWKIYKIEYFILVMISVNVLLVYFIKSISINTQKENLSRLSKLLKLNMMIGLIAIYIGIQ